VTVTLRKNGSAVQGQIITSSDAGGIPTQTFSFTPGQWHHFDVRITTSAQGSATGAVMTSVNGGSFFGTTNAQIYLTGSTDYRPKWGLYRGIGVSDGVPVGDSWVEHRTVTGTIGSTNVLTWKGGTNSNAWDTSAAANFLNAGTASIFNTLDQVNFDDSSTNTTVNLSGAVFPGYIRVNSSQNYTFAGTGSLTGGTLRKDGSGMLTLATTNSYAGLTDVRAGTLLVTGSIGNNSLVSLTGGTLRAGSNAALGTNSTIGAQINGGALDINGFNLSTEPITVQGSGVSGAGAIVNTGAQQINALTNVTLSADTTLGGSGRWDIRGSGAALRTGGASFNLTKTGSNQVSLVGATVDAALGNININQGILSFQTSTTSMGDPGKTVTVASGAALGFFNTSNVMNKLAILTGGTIWAESGTGNQNTFAGSITLNGVGGTLDTGSPLTGGSPNPNAVLNITGNIAGAGSLNKSGGGTATLAGTNSYTGNTNVNGGMLVLNKSFTSTGSVNIANSAALKLGPGTAANFVVLKTPSLTISGTGVLDLTNSALIVDYSGATPLQTIRTLITQGYANGTWAGPGITTSLAGTDKALGYADNASRGLANFAGQQVDSTSILVKYTYLGDADIDGAVDVSDLGVLATNWQSSADWSGGDFNYDGFVDVTDLGLLATNWQAGVGNPLGAVSLDQALASLGLTNLNVPEPAMLSGLLLLATLYTRRARVSRL
jgi:autotransporter-associated beta strand protein